MSAHGNYWSHGTNKQQAARDALHRAVICARIGNARDEIPLTEFSTVEPLMHGALRYDGQSVIDEFCQDLLNAARKLGFVVEDGNGDLLPGVLDVISNVITRAIWFGLTEGHILIGGSADIPYRLFPEVLPV